jgi:hypothetical protein
MLDETDFIAPVADSFQDLALVAREAIHQRWDAADHAGAIAEGSRRLSATGGWQRDNRKAVDQSRGQVHARIGCSRLAEENEVHGARASEILDQ